MTIHNKEEHTVTIAVKLPSKQYGEIEEYCLNKAISISDYFFALHELSQQHQWALKKERQGRFGENPAQFGRMEHSPMEHFADEEDQSKGLDERIQDTVKHKKKKLKQ